MSNDEFLISNVEVVCGYGCGRLRLAACPLGMSNDEYRISNVEVGAVLPPTFVGDAIDPCT
jgi:hypothetical protein